MNKGCSLKKNPKDLQKTHIDAYTKTDGHMYHSSNRQTYLACLPAGALHHPKEEVEFTRETELLLTDVLEESRPQGLQKEEYLHSKAEEYTHC